MWLKNETGEKISNVRGKVRMSRSDDSKFVVPFNFDHMEKDEVKTLTDDGKWSQWNPKRAEVILEPPAGPGSKK